MTRASVSICSVFISRGVAAGSSVGWVVITLSCSQLYRRLASGYQTLQRARKFLIAIAKNRSELETEQDLRTENQYPRLVQSKLDLFCELHVANAGSTERR
jgi:hypothetical protein